jgi:insulysin
MFKAFELSNSITFNSSPSKSSINININALNDESNLKLLLNDLKEFLFNLDINKLSEDYIENLIISLKDSYKNINFRNPSDYSLNKIISYVYDTEYPIEQLISATEIIDINKIKQYLKNILNDSIITSFVYGNIEQKFIPELLEPYNNYFIKSNLTIPISHEIQEINILHPNPDEKSNCITIYYYIGELYIENESDALVNIMAVIGTRILSQEFFNDLRTIKQLGYIVSMSMSSYRNKYYITQKIQSDKTIDEIIKNIHEFNNKITEFLEKSDYDNFKKSIKKELIEQDYSLNDKVNKYLPEITSHEYIFNRHLLLYNQVDNVCIKDIIKYFDKILLKPIRVIINGN